MIRFLSLASGSSGNCYCLVSEYTTILIDAGIGLRTIKRRLGEFDLDLNNVHAVLLTHDHADHIKGVGALATKMQIPIYLTKKVYNGMNRSYCIKGNISDNMHYININDTFVIGEFQITAFNVPHDSSENVGYFIEVENKHFCIVTDVGHITEIVASYLSKSEYIVLEANYDETMLKMGKYPASLKERILGPNGHLSNQEVAEFLANNYSPDWKYVWLCHLSKDNNTPETAYQKIKLSLNEIGVTIGEDVQIIPLRRNLPTGIYDLSD